MGILRIDISMFPYLGILVTSRDRDVFNVTLHWFGLWELVIYITGLKWLCAKLGRII